MIFKIIPLTALLLTLFTVVTRTDRVGGQKAIHQSANGEDRKKLGCALAVVADLEIARAQSKPSSAIRSYVGLSLKRELTW